MIDGLAIFIQDHDIGSLGRVAVLVIAELTGWKIQILNSSQSISYLCGIFKCASGLPSILEDQEGFISQVCVAGRTASIRIQFFELGYEGLNALIRALRGEQSHMHAAFCICCACEFSNCRVIPRVRAEELGLHASVFQLLNLEAEFAEVVRHPQDICIAGLLQAGDLCIKVLNICACISFFGQDFAAKIFESILKGLSKTSCIVVSIAVQDGSGLCAQLVDAILCCCNALIRVDEASSEDIVAFLGDLIVCGGGTDNRNLCLLCYGCLLYTSRCV